jgi:hypothetical protein
MPLEMLHEGDARAQLREWADAQLLSYGQAGCRACRRRDVPLTARRFLEPAGGRRQAVTKILCAPCASAERRRAIGAELRAGWRPSRLPGKVKALAWALRGGLPDRSTSAGLLTTHAARLAVKKDFAGAERALRAAGRYGRNPDLLDVTRVLRAVMDGSAEDEGALAGRSQGAS